MKMPVERGEKVTAFIALLILFVLVGWPDFDRRVVWRLFLLFSTGAGVALWAGREQISIFRPTTLAAWWIFFGAGAMVWSFVMLLAIRFR